MKNLYVGNLPHSTSESELRTLFQAHGEVEKVSIVTDRETGRARGFAFVEVTNPGCQEAERHLPSARKNKRVSRNNAIKPSAGTSGSRRKPKAAWTRCANCVSTPKHRQRFSASARMKPTLPSHPPRMKAGTSIS